MKTLIIILLCMFSCNIAQGNSVPLPEQMQILSQEIFNPKIFELEDQDWRWLGNKRELKVAIWQPEIPPLSIFSGDSRYEGMIADYIFLAAQYLGVKLIIQRFTDREAAMHALILNQVDMVADPSGKDFPTHSGLVSSHNFISDHPVLVHRLTNMNAPFQYENGMRLAIARWYVDDSWIEANFPGVRIMHFNTDDEALASVAFNDNDFYVGNLVTTSYLLERNYSHYLTFQQVYPERDTGSHFVMRSNDETLVRAVNRVLKAIPSTQNQVILQQWSDRANLWRVNKKVAFSETEKKWLAKNKSIGVSVNAFYAPFTMIDANGDFYGVTADILRLIRLRTGIHFFPVSADSVSEMEKQVESKKAIFIGAMSQSDERDDKLLFSRPYFNSPFVLIGRSEASGKQPLSPGTRVAVVRKNGLIAKLERDNPGIKIMETTNASIALQMVDNGNADVAVHTLFGASYMVDRYFRDRLKIFGQIGNDSANIAFAIARDQPELFGIINKSLQNISPADINSIIDKWQTRPDVRLDTWELYRTQFWLVLSVAGLIILTSILWIYYLRREVRARRAAQQNLQSQLEQNEALTQALSEARERAEQANRAKSTFLATMSHEIRTPVSAIIGLLELAVKTSPEQVKEDDPVRVAWESARTLMGLIGDILDMARIESGRLELTPEWVRSIELLPPVVRVFEGLARQKSLRLQCNLPVQLPNQLFIDPLRVRQVLSNLVSNAIKFTDRGSVKVEMSLDARTGGGAMLKISVSDTGKGISLAEQQDIFDPWVQVGSGRTQVGSGLGLAICAQLVHKMNGEISMKSLPGHGTTVCFEVPVEQREEQPERQVPVKTESLVTHQPLRILAVDDHPANRMLLRRQLTHLGHWVIEANDGKEAWKTWCNEKIDVVITDCSMPGMDGLALTRLIREHQIEPVKIFGLTANAWPEERDRCLSAGMDDCMFKPLQLPQLQSILDLVIKTQPGSERDTKVQQDLKQLIDYDKLLTLSDYDEAMLMELLQVTLSTNLDDLQRAEDLIELQDWPELGKCLHRITGAAKICGAEKAEAACRAMEIACKHPLSDEEQICALWAKVTEVLTEVNQAISAWLTIRTSKS